jgi:enamine deaminase RidA (YjgF/YER057c/UK114 family)
MSGRELPVILAVGTTQTLAWASSVYLPAILADPIAHDLMVSANWLFGAYSAALAVAAVLGPRVGRKIDRVGGRPVLSLSNLMLAVGLGLLGLAQSVPLLVIAWLVLGVGMGYGLYDAAFGALGRIYGKAARGPITGITLIAGFASTIGWPLMLPERSPQPSGRFGRLGKHPSPISWIGYLRPSPRQFAQTLSALGHHAAAGLCDLFGLAGAGVGGVVLGGNAAAKEDRHNWPAARYPPTEMDFPITGFIAMTSAPSIARINPPELGTPPGYSQIVEVSAKRIIFIAGQTALDRDGNVAGQGNFAAQAAQVFDNLTVALAAVECTPANLVKLTVFLTDMGNLAAYRAARNRFFANVTPPAAPAVTLVEVSKLYGPDFLIEIEAIAAA